ncbi:MAG: Hsp20 family protein [SAR202 cluster bacterium]|nr:Hsp20 family protein [SAR202 cluster bacterium]|tara:strand:+ start:12405 stop:12812 length:408 start_codon:yes stop_codon:yes gene_type:complete
MTNSTLIQDFLRRSVGWEHLLSQVVSTNNRSNFPPFNIVKDGDGTQIQLALAGYSRDDISVTIQDKVLTISSSGVDKQDDIEYNYRGVAKRAFTTKFSLGQYHEVKDVSMRDGMLYVSTEEVLPEEKKLKTFTIN